MLRLRVEHLCRLYYSCDIWKGVRCQPFSHSFYGLSSAYCLRCTAIFKNQNVSESSNLKYNNQEWYIHPKLLAFQVEYTPCKSDKVHGDLYTKETCMPETVAIS